MNLNISKTIAVLGVAMAALLFIGCNSHDPDDGHDHGEPAEAYGEEGHDEELTTSLTPDQLKAAGIMLGDIELKNLTATIKVNGSLRVPNRNSAHATSLYGGVIKTLSVELGDNVRKGQVIATIENPQFVQLQEEYLTVGSQLILAEQELGRQRELNAGNAGAKKNLQDATSNLAILSARKASLQQRIQLMGISPSSINSSSLKNILVIASPISGTISNVFAKIGSYVDVSSPIAEIVDNSQLHLDLQVFEQDLPKIKVGQLITFTITNNPAVNYSAKVYNIGSSFQNESKTIAVHSMIQGDKSGLIDGMNVTAMVNLENVSTPTVMDDAIVEAGGKFYIFVHVDKTAQATHDETDHDHEAGEDQHYNESVSFEKIEVAKGVSYMGYTAITAVKTVPDDAKVVTKGAFFINAKMSDSGEHAHAH